MKKFLVFCLVFVFGNFSLMADGHDGDEEGSGSMLDYWSVGLAFNASGGDMGSGGGYTLDSSYAFGENAYLYLNTNKLDGDFMTSSADLEYDYRTIGLGYVFMRDWWLFSDNEEMKESGHSNLSSIRVALLMDEMYVRIPQINTLWIKYEAGASIGFHDISRYPNGSEFVSGWDNVDYEGVGAAQGFNFSGTRYYLGYFTPLGDDAQNKVGLMYTKTANEEGLNGDQTFWSLVWKMQR